MRLFVKMRTIQVLFKNSPNAGFTMIELVMVIVVMAALAAVSVPRINDFITNSKIQASKNEMLQIRAAISGTPDRTAGGRYVDRGYIGDVGAVPSSLNDLITNPGLPAYDYFSRTGWNGPYLVDNGTGEILRDAWLVNYVLNVADSTIRSFGPNKIDDLGTGDDIVIKYR
ncbi:type II secretion system protein [Candidatus Marinimicrobia bacterium MT.SAG.2]|nr:type II secretion system protein [Candidatus Marinimicrobia bacterium MT.SAG.2]